jgi:hypothetical protein
MDGAAVRSTVSLMPCTRRWVRYNIHIQKQTQHINCTHLFAFWMAFPATSGWSKSMGKVWVAGAAVRLTAAAVPSRELVDSRPRWLRRRRRWWLEIDDCSDGAGAADNGLRWGWKEADVFSVEIDGGEEIWPTWWSSGHFCHGEMKITLFARKSSKRGGRERMIWIFI